MKVAILCGGLGTRLGDLTRDLPKPMIEIGGRPYLEYVVDSFRGFDVVLLTGHKSEVIEAHFGDRVTYSRESEPLGTGGALRQARALLGDLYVGKPMLSVLRSHRLVPAAGLSAARNIERVVLGDSLFHQNVVAPRMGAHVQASRVFWLRKFTEDEVRADRAGRDSLTGLHNRKTFERDLRRQVHEATTNAPAAIALWSLDHFKATCDEYGEQVGDQLLRSFANALAEQIRPGDCLYRLDGETFAIVYPGADLIRAESAVQRLLLALGGQTVEAAGLAFNISASVGLTVAKPREATAALMARADAALHSAKDGGGGCCITAAPEAK